MADFCWQCCEGVLGVDGEGNDFEGSCEPNEISHVLCEGCGKVRVDHRGVCQGGDGCSQRHVPMPDGCLVVEEGEEE